MSKIITINEQKVEFYNNSWIIWKSHSADFKYGSYYLLKSDGNVDFIIETCDNVRVISNINERK